MVESKLPNSLIKLSKKLFESADQQEKFLECFVTLPAREHALISLTDSPVAGDSPLAYFPPWVHRVREFSSEQHDQGHFYALDSSSVFAASPLLQLEPPELIFDACAAPGGKSVFAWRAHKPKLLIANEFVEKRLKPLISNFQRCQIRPSEVFHLPTKRVGEMFPECFPVVMVDAPCSGQSLLLKGERVDGAFHPQTVNGNLKRQRRILAELAPSVAPGGHLLYMTCTFSPEENEEIIEWFLKKFPKFKTVPVPALDAYKTQLSDIHGYRLWPQDKMGAGSFTALLQNTDDGAPSALPEDYKPVWRLE
jgi:16S rRNA C967 or C1407 C5-methylase (RsmB/RsmF family)